MPTLEQLELHKFYTNIQEEVKSTLIADDDGTTPEQIFTEYVLFLLAECGETENYRTCYDEKISKRGIEHKINGYALYENYETLDLFITIFNGTDTIQSITKTEADKAIDRIIKFFKNAVYKDYVTEIEESSQVFDLAQTLSGLKDVKEYLSRVNIFLISDGEIKADFKIKEKIAGYFIFYRIIDINYLFNISEKSRIPIEIDFVEKSSPLPCIITNNPNEEYQSYLAIIPGEILANIYEQFGSRLLEQNVRSFLQFTGKINKGIRKTIMEEPNMFLAFNNGIAATADEVKIINLPSGKGHAISYVRDLQIVNGGQTTASIYHTWKKDKANISNIFVQLKLSVVKDKKRFSEIVSRISEYANTQNRVSVADLSSNKPIHIELEKLSRNIWAPPQMGQTQQTIWFYERARGQYKNAIQKFGFTKAKRKSFELRNPKKQVFTKEDLAKYINSWQEVKDGKKLVIGPHFVVRGNQKNYVQFMNYNFDKKPDNIFFEDAIAKTILFRSAEKIYGVKPNSIGDMRYITVPYAISWLGYQLDYKLDLYKIWKNQVISDTIKDKLYEIMVAVEKYIRKNAPGSLYGEWAKKEECWDFVKNQDFGIDLSSLKTELISSASVNKRKRINDAEIERNEYETHVERIKSVHYKIWRNIEEWGNVTKMLTPYLGDITNNISKKIKINKILTDLEITQGNKILDIVIAKSPELFFNLDEIIDEEINVPKSDFKDIIELVNKVLDWDFKNRKLQDYEYRFLLGFSKGEIPPSDKNIKIVDINLKKAKYHGFIE